MKIDLILFDGIKNRELHSLVDYYLRLTGKYNPIELVVLKEKSREQVALKKLERKFSSGTNIVLSERGKLFTTQEFASLMEHYRARVPLLNLYVGNAFGFEPEVEKKADLVLALSPLTLAHEMAAVVLLEQLFRVFNLMAGGAYHK